MRRAAGDVVGKTVAAQVRQAARNLGLEPDSWRVREAWYGRAGSWSAAAVNDLRRRHAAWWTPQIVARSGAESEHGRPMLATRVDAIRAGLVELTGQVDELAAEVAAVDRERR